MEIILAIIVASAVIFFGALISIGNERQRGAIDSLREQVVLWAMQDLRLKREKLIHEVKMDDPLAWLNKMASHVAGHDLKLQIIAVDHDPTSLVCLSESQGCSVIFCHLSPTDLRRIRRTKQSKLFPLSGKNIFSSLPKNATPYKLSLLNENYLFDLELPLAWQSLTGIDTYSVEYLWMYIFDRDFSR